MVALQILGKLPHFKTFEPKTLTSQKIRNLTMRTHQSRIFASELILEAFKRGKLGVGRDLVIALLKREKFYLRTRIKKFRLLF
jgi:hypothetical protein